MHRSTRRRVVGHCGRRCRATIAMMAIRSEGFEGEHTWARRCRSGCRCDSWRCWHSPSVFFHNLGRPLRASLLCCAALCTANPNADSVAHSHSCPRRTQVVRWRTVQVALIIFVQVPLVKLVDLGLGSRGHLRFGRRFGRRLGRFRSQTDIVV